MSTPSSLFAKPVDAPDEGYTRYEIEVAGQKIFADLNPEWVASLKMAHIAFRSKEDGTPNPTSETGYRSHFVEGTVQGMSDEDVRHELQRVGEEIAREG